MSVSTDDIVSAFEDLGIDLEEPKVVDLLASLCDIYRVDVDRISTEVMAFMYKRKMGASATPTATILGDFENEVLKKIGEKRKEDAARGIVDVTNLISNPDEDDMDDATLLVYGMKTPSSAAKGDKRPKEAQEGNETRKKLLATDGGGVPFSPASFKPAGDTPNSRKYQSRPNAGGVAVRFGEIGATSWKTGKEAEIPTKVQMQEGTLAKPYRYMFETLQSKAGRLDETICKLGELIAEKRKEEEEKTQLGEPVDFSRSWPDPVFCLGRICCDSSEGRLNTQSILLQGTQDICDGRCVALDTSRAGEFSLFPGQVVLAEASNPAGSRLIATRFLSDASPPLPSNPDRISSGGPPLSVLAAAGPYTTSDNLGYEPLRDLLRYLLAHRPHLAILAGPFVDVRHDLISGGTGTDVQESYDDTFKRIMKMIVEAAAEIPSTQIVLVSSMSDAHHLDIYPTPPFSCSEISDLQLPPNITMAPDPCIFSVEGIVFGTTSTDVLFHLGREEISAPPRSGDRLRRLATHLLQQRSFYPLYPPNNEMNIDFEKLEAHGQINRLPHVLILPSDFQHFFKDVNGSLVLNPSRLARKEAGGFFARFLIRPVEADEQTFTKRITGEVVRI